MRLTNRTFQLVSSIKAFLIISYFPAPWEKILTHQNYTQRERKVFSSFALQDARRACIMEGKSTSADGSARKQAFLVNEAKENDVAFTKKSTN